MLTLAGSHAAHLLLKLIFSELRVCLYLSLHVCAVLRHRKNTRNETFKRAPPLLRTQLNTLRMRTPAHGH